MCVYSSPYSHHTVLSFTQHSKCSLHCNKHSDYDSIYVNVSQVIVLMTKMFIVTGIPLIQILVRKMGYNNITKMVVVF